MFFITFREWDVSYFLVSEREKARARDRQSESESKFSLLRDMTLHFVWHSGVLWLVCMCDMRDSFICDMNHSHVPWFIHMCDTVHTCGMTRLYVWHERHERRDLWIRVMGLMNASPMSCGMTRLYVWHEPCDLWIQVMWLMNTHTYEYTYKRVMSDAFRTKSFLE